MSTLSGQTTIVVGASRGLGHGIATALAAAGAPVIADAADATVPARLLDRYQPHAVILAAGATPHYRPLHQQTWQTFSVNWQTDVQMTFHWLREALLTPIRPGSRMVVVSSGAALNGSPLSGGYAGAKATQRFITAYAQDEANRAGLDITFTAVLPAAHGPAAPMTGVGEPAVRAYAARAGQSLPDYLQQLGPQVTPEIAGTAIVGLVQADAATITPAYLLNAAGLHELP